MVNQRYARRTATSALALTMALGLAAQTESTAQTWTGNGTTNKWSDNRTHFLGDQLFVGGNWLFGSLPIDGSVVSIDPTIGSSFSTMDNDISGLSLDRLHFAANAREMRLTGNKIELNDSGRALHNASLKEQNIDLDLKVSADQYWESGRLLFEVIRNRVFNTLTDINGDVEVNADLTLEGDFNLDGNLTGTGDITIQKWSTQGQTSQGGSFEYSGVNNRVRMTGSNGNYTGDITIEEEAKLRLDGGNNLSNSTNVFVDGELEIRNEGEIFGGLKGGATGRVNLNDGFGIAVGVNDEDTTFSGEIFGSGDFTKRGTGTLTLDGTNTNSLTIVEEGTLKIGGGNVLSDDGVLQIDGGAFDLNGTDETVSSVRLFSGTILGEGTLTANAFVLHSGIVSSNLGGGDLYKGTENTVVLRGTNTYSGETNIYGGTLQISAAENLGSSSLRFGGALPLFVEGATLRTTNSVVLENDVVLQETGIFGVDSGSTLTLNGLVSGVGDLVKSSSGIMVLNGANTYTGDTVIQGGTLQVSDGENLGAANNHLSLHGGRLWTTSDFTNDRTTDVSGIGRIQVFTDTTFTQNTNITGTGRFEKEGNGTMVLNGLVASITELRIKNGVFQTGSDQRLKNTMRVRTQGDGVFELDHTETVGTVTVEGGGVTGSGTLIASKYEMEDGEVSVNLAGKGNTRLEKNEDGTVILSGTNSYSGGTEINRGTLSISADNNLGTGAITLNEATLRTTDDIVMTRAITLTGECIGSNSACGINNGGGGNGGGGGGNGGGGGGNNNNDPEPLPPRFGTFEVDGSTTLTLNGVVSGEGGLAKDGAGTLVLNGSNSYAGGTRVNEGTLQGTTDGLQGDIVNDAVLVFDQVTDGDYDDEISGTGSLRKSGDGTVTLTGANSYQGATTVNGGTLALSSNGSIASTAINIGEAGTFDFSAKGGDIFGGTLVNQGVVRANGLQLTGTVSGAGGYEGSVTFNGNFRPGNSPALISAQDVIFGASNNLFMEIGGLGRGTEYDAFDISGAVTFGGLLDLSFINGFLPSGPSTFDLFNFGSASSTFANVILPTLDSMWLWNTDSLYTDGSISIVAAVIDTGVPGPGAILILVVGLAGFGAVRGKRAK